jgi:hypothetical protein
MRERQKELAEVLQAAGGRVVTVGALASRLYGGDEPANRQALRDVVYRMRQAGVQVETSYDGRCRGRGPASGYRWPEVHGA